MKFIYVYSGTERGEGQGARGHRERRRARAGTGGPLCHLPHSLRASGRHTKAHDDFLPSFLSLAITVVTVADTVKSQGYSYSVLWGAAWACQEAALARAR